MHAAVAGRHTRHGQLLPLECYLEEGIPLVSMIIAIHGKLFSSLHHCSAMAAACQLSARHSMLLNHASSLPHAHPPVVDRAPEH